MTQHFLQEHIDEDRQIMRRLSVVVGGFIIASAAMAVIISAVFS